MSKEQGREPSKGVGNESVRYRDLPLISTMKTHTFQQAKVLLEELESVQETKDLAEKREKELKLELEQIQTKAGVAGLRYGNLCFVARQMEGRETLDRGKLIENGVSPKIIAKSIVKGEPYVTRTFKVLDE